MFDISYNNVRPSAFNAFLGTIPILTPSSKSRTRQEVPAMDGELLVDDVADMDAFWEFTIHLKRDDLQAKMRQIRHWLSGTGTLIMLDSPDSFYEVKEVNYSTIMKKSDEYGRVGVKMEVYPYEFLASGETEITSYSTIANNADMSKPLYIITGNGSGTLTVNGHAMTFTVTNNLYIDTRRKMAYTIVNNAIQGADGVVNGDYEGLYLASGNNSISCTAGTLKVKPRWGYRI